MGTSDIVALLGFLFGLLAQKTAAFRIAYKEKKFHRHQGKRAA